MLEIILSIYLTKAIFWTGLGELAEDNCFVCRRREEVEGEQRRRRANEPTNMNDPLAYSFTDAERTPDGLAIAGERGGERGWLVGPLPRRRQKRKREKRE